MTAMYTEFFGLESAPFSIAPDPRFLYMSERHREALAHLLYGLRSDGGFVLLTGEVGTGKTTVCRCLLEQIPAGTNLAFIFNPKLTVHELLATLCDELEIDYPEEVHSTKVFIDAITRFLLDAHARGERTVLVIDEAQQLSYRVLEQIRLLTNLETNEQKLLRIILLGQPELAEKLARPELRQLAQRITARYHLLPLTRAETRAYVQHRLGVARGDHRILSAASIKRIHDLSQGIPRLINILCDRSLLGAYVEERPTVTPRIVKRAANEVNGVIPQQRWRTPTAVAAALLMCVGLGASVSYYLGLHERSQVSFFQGSPTEPIASLPLGPDTGGIGTNAELPTPEKITLDEAPAVSLPQADTAAVLQGPSVDASKERALTMMSSDHTDDALTGEPDWGLEWPAALPPEVSHHLAFAALFDRWHTPFEMDSPLTVCDYAQRVGLRCLDRRGNLRSIMELDRPAVLELADESGDSYHAALLAIRGDEADLVIGNRRVRASLTELDARWRGRYSILWQMPPAYRWAISEGDRGEPVAWLRERLSEMSLEGPDPEVRDPQHFDAELAQMLRSFQADHGLVPDAVAGAHTWIQLNTILGVGVPRVLTP